MEKVVSLDWNWTYIICFSQLHNKVAKSDFKPYFEPNESEEVINFKQSNFSSCILVQMFASLHDLCLSQLDHPLNQALVCGKRWPNSEVKTLIINYNLIHLFVVSGAHALFFEKGLKALRFNKSFQLSTLGVYVLCCNFSSPIGRCFTERIINLATKKNHLYFPVQFQKIFSGLVYLPISYTKDECISLLLSVYFSQVVASIGTKRGFELKLLLVSFPVYAAVLGTPPISALLVLFIATPLIGGLLLPLSFLALISDKVEWLSHSIWWCVLDALNYLEVFFNYPKKSAADFGNSHWMLIHLMAITLITYSGLIFWKRKSFFT